jgi:hypothetical protein
MKNNAILKQDFQRYEEQMVDWIKIKVLMFQTTKTTKWQESPHTYQY